MIKDLKDLLKEEKVSLYDYVASNYYKLDKEELKELLLNMIYVLFSYDNDLCESLEVEAIKETIERGE